VESKINVLKQLAQELDNLASDTDFLYRIESQNNWFTPDFVQLSIKSITENYLEEKALRTWLEGYTIEDKDHVAIILAGNIPLVGFHDVLCSYFAASRVSIKLSSKDHILTKAVLDIWSKLDSDWARRMQIIERIESCDKIIATGSNSSYHYFELYFKKYKSILRKNRTSIAIVHKDMTDEELDFLIDDIFLYFGLGCRNVSKLWIEKGFELSRIFEASEKYNRCFQHSKYMNNYDYQRTLLLLNSIEHLSNNFLMLKPDNSLFSAISVLHYEIFENEKEVQSDLELHKDDIQCVIGRGYVPYGQGQSPQLSDYADGVDTMQFLLS
jgi:hypothetical protein